MEFLAGLHPRIVHFPIAFFTLYFFFEMFGIILKKDFLLKAAFIILIAGVITALGAVLTGNQAHAAAKLIANEDVNLFNPLIDSSLAEHEQYATITLWYFTAVLILRTYLLVKKNFGDFSFSEKSNWKYFFIALGLIGCYLIYITGIHGGNLVLKHGIGTQLFGK